MVMGECRTFTVGQKSLLGDESREDGLDDRERGDMGLGSGDATCCSTGQKDDRIKVTICNFCKKYVFLHIC